MLRRLVVEWSLLEINRKLKDPQTLQHLSDVSVDTKNTVLALRTLESLKRLKLIEVLQLLRFDSEEFAAIIKITAKKPSDNPESLLCAIFAVVKGKIQLLESEKDGTYTYFISGIMPPQSPETDSKRIMYPSMPFRFKDGKFRATLIGDSEQVKLLLETFDCLHLGYRVVSLTDASFSPTSPINCLTLKQQDAIALAFRLGYFDTPRRISVEELATRLGLASSTLAVHLRRAEHRLLAEVLKEKN